MLKHLNDYNLPLVKNKDARIVSVCL